MKLEASGAAVRAVNVERFKDSSQVAAWKALAKGKRPQRVVGARLERPACHASAAGRFRRAKRVPRRLFGGANQHHDSQQLRVQELWRCRGQPGLSAVQQALPEVRRAAALTLVQPQVLLALAQPACT